MAAQLAPVRKRVALKLFREVVDLVRFTTRMETELESLSRINHPSMARVLNGGISNVGHPFLVMELVQGPPMLLYCDQRRLGLAPRMEMIRQIGEAVHHAHEHGIYFGKLKLSDIRIATCNGIPVPKIIGFGKTRSYPSEIERDASPYHLGTKLSSISDEHSVGEAKAIDSDKQANVRSLGSLAQELLTRSNILEREKVENLDPLTPRWFSRPSDGRSPDLPLSSAELNDFVGSFEMQNGRFTRSQQLEAALSQVFLKASHQDQALSYLNAGQFVSDIERLRTNYFGSSRPFPVFCILTIQTLQRMAMLLVVIVGILMIVLLCCYA